MFEINALLGLAWRRSHRTATLYAIAILILWALSYFFSRSTAADDSLLGIVCGYLMFFVMLPAGAWGIFLLDFTDDGSVSERGSGFSHWLFRMPIETWKLAAVPIVIKTCWIVSVWFVFTLCCRNLGAQGWWMMALAVPASCIGIWVFALNWMSTRWRYSKIAFVFLLLPTSFAAIGCSVSAMIPPRPGYAIAAVVAVSVVIYGLSVVVAYRLLKVARVNAAGIILPLGDSARTIGHEVGTEDPLGSSVRAAKPGGKGEANHPRTHASASAALTWHDLEKSHSFRLKLLLMVVLPGAICGAMLGAFSGTIVVLSLGFIWLSAAASSSIAASCQRGQSTTLPPYVVASPLTSPQIAWSQMKASARTTSMIFLVLAITCLILCIDSGRRAQWEHWAEGVASLPSVSGGAMEVGLQYSAAWLVGLVVLMIVMPLHTEWISMSGRQWVAILVGAIAGCLVFGSVSAVLGWFLVQTDYDSAWENARWWQQWLPHLVLGLCAMKLVVTAIVTTKLAQSSLLTAKFQLLIFVAWGLAALALATIFYFLIPDTRVEFLACLIVVGLLLPLSSIQAMPLSVHWNRHR